jgi:hypothetical protein
MYCSYNATLNGNSTCRTNNYIPALTSKNGIYNWGKKKKKRRKSNQKTFCGSKLGISIPIKIFGFCVKEMSI